MVTNTNYKKELALIRERADVVIRRWCYLVWNIMHTPKSSKIKNLNELGLNSTLELDNLKPSAKDL